ncbi:hypothetical protein, partial [Serratia marcescens]|uniref:hypothetical protein n=1 Tax=Serratia marcescens TaxID=615 RepID=UPI001F18F0BC
IKIQQDKKSPFRRQFVPFLIIRAYAQPRLALVYFSLVLPVISLSGLFSISGSHRTLRRTAPC